MSGAWQHPTDVPFVCKFWSHCVVCELWPPPKRCLIFTLGHRWAHSVDRAITHRHSWCTLFKSILQPFWDPLQPVCSFISKLFYSSLFEHDTRLMCISVCVWLVKGISFSCRWWFSALATVTSVVYGHRIENILGLFTYSWQRLSSVDLHCPTFNDVIRDCCAAC